ncbi:MAG TPA: DUF6265 family protein [Allosphingosinicella sp.]|jgi:hypothetical protein
MGKALTAMLAMVLSTGFSFVSQTATLSWLAGHWVEDRKDGWAEENWAPPRGGVMLGTGVTGQANEAKSFEFMRIAQSPEDGRLLFWGSPGGKSAVAFASVMQGRQEVVFENPKHDYPTRISYKREGDFLTAATSGPGGSNRQTWRYRRVRD